MALQKGPSHGTGGPSGQVFNQRRNPGRPECEHRWGATGWGAPGRGPQRLASEGLDSVPTGPPRFSMAPAGRARQRARTRARNWTECRREKQPTGGVKRPGGGGARPSGTSSRTRVREWSGHKGCMRPCPEPRSPQAGEGRGPRAQQQLTGEAAPRAGRPSWSWHPGPPRAQRRITCPGCAPAPRLTLLRRERQLPGMQRQLQGGVLLGHEGLQVQREGHDVLPDLKHGAARLARHDAPGERLSRGACA